MSITPTPANIDAYRTAMHGVTVLMPDEALAALRTIRLWHWRSVLCWRKIADTMTVRCNRSAAAKVSANDQANFHLGIVQTLNDYFPSGDHAQYDMEKEDDETDARRG